MAIDKFDYWWTDNDLCSSDMLNRAACRVLWDAATKEEREACAKVCEDLRDEWRRMKTRQASLPLKST